MIREYKSSDVRKQISINVRLGESTVATHTVNVFEDNAIQNLFDEVKRMARELKKTTHPDLKIRRGYTKEQIHALNFELQTTYKRNIEEFMNIVDNLPYLQDEFVTLSQMRAFTAIANHYGRHGSRTFLDYASVINTVVELEKIKYTLEHENEGMLSITI